MTDQGQPPRASKPTEPMLAFAQRIAAKLNIDMSDHPDVLSNFDACKAFIDTNLPQFNKPTEKQLNFASRIATEKGLVVPPEVLADGRELSRWLDANK